LIVYATGYSSMNGFVGLGWNTTKDPGPWEGEQRNMWKQTQQEGLWFHGGSLHQPRHFSQCLSLQLKARHEGIATPAYGLQTVCHKAFVSWQGGSLHEVGNFMHGAALGSKR